MLNDSFDFQGLVALLGAVDALSRVEGFSNLKKQVPCEFVVSKLY